jgi:hypothetical protein
LEINQELKGDFFNDPEYKELFCQWLNIKWIEKDKRIDLIKADCDPASVLSRILPES